MVARSARSKLYDGVVYGRLLEPLLQGVHGFVVERLPDGNHVLDACCGTGGLARQLARSGRRVVGVDLSPRNIAYARQASASTPSEQLRFEVGDVAALGVPEDGPYDVGTIVLALHEMPELFRLPVLTNLLRITRRLMIVDFAIPMPRNLAGLRNRGLEFAAGHDHFSAFRSFTRRGGLPVLLDEAGAVVETDRRIDDGTLQVVCVRAPSDASL